MLKKLKKTNKKVIFTLIFIFIFITMGVGSFWGAPHSGFESNPTLSTNYLFNGKSYTFNLDDFYDDTDLTKIYTGANFSTEAFNETSLEWSGTVNNDTVSPVNNTETQYGDPSNINMLNGTTDSADNMKTLDASYTTFTSTSLGGLSYESPDQWDDFTFTKGSGNSVGELETNNGNYGIIDAEFTAGGEVLLGYIVPADSDISSQWNEGSGSPHWSAIDEAKGDMDGDGGSVFPVYFAPINLQILLMKNDIEYLRFQALGNPSVLRKQARDNFELAKELYLEYIFNDLKARQQLVELFKKLRFRKNYCLICYCRTLDPRICHRFWLKETLVNEKRIKLGFEGNYVIKCHYKNPVPEVN